MTRNDYCEYNENAAHERGYLIPTIKAGILGAGIAALTTYFLFGTEKGQRARKQIIKAAHSAKNKAMETAGDLAETGKEIYDDMASFLEERKEQIKNLDSKDIVGLTQRIRDRWEETKEDIEETLDTD
jgi:hypothetical protein